MKKKETTKNMKKILNSSFQRILAYFFQNFGLMGFNFVVFGSQKIINHFMPRNRRQRLSDLRQ